MVKGHQSKTNVGKGSRQIRSVPSVEGLALKGGLVGFTRVNVEVTSVQAGCYGPRARIIPATYCYTLLRDNL